MSSSLFQTVANIGSTLTSVSHDVENIQTAIEEYKKSTEILQNDVVRKCTDLTLCFNGYLLNMKQVEELCGVLPYAFKIILKFQ